VAGQHNANAVLRLYEVSTYPGGTPDEHVQHTTANQCSVAPPVVPTIEPAGFEVVTSSSPADRVCQSAVVILGPWSYCSLQ